MYAEVVLSPDACDLWNGLVVVMRGSKSQIQKQAWRQRRAPNLDGGVRRDVR